MIDKKDWRANRISERVYAESKMEWKKYVRGARAAAITPNLDGLAGIERQWVKLVPNRTANSTFYTNLDKDEIFKR